MSVVPRFLCAVDGVLHIPLDKAILIHAVENTKTELPNLDDKQGSQDAQLYSLNCLYYDSPPRNEENLVDEEIIRSPGSLHKSH